ncbi:hypothetical protein [Streptomyces sp. MAI_2237]
MYPARTCPRVLLLTSGPLEGQEGGAERGRSVVEFRFGLDRFRAHDADLYKEMLR